MLLQHSFELSQPVIGSIVSLEVQQPPQLLDHRIEGTILVVGRAAPLDPDMRFTGQEFREHPHQA